MEKDIDEDATEIVDVSNLFLEMVDTDGDTVPDSLACLTIYELVSNAGNDPDGVGAYEFQLKFDHKIFDISIEDSSWLSNGGTRTVDCSMSIFLENDIRWGCVSEGPLPGQTSDGTAAIITVCPEPDLVNRLTPGQENGVVRTLLDENCELADVFGDPLQLADGSLAPGVLAGGLLKVCSDMTITVRILEADLDLDCEVDVADAAAIAFRYGSAFGNLLYDPWYDLEPALKDFDIDINEALRSGVFVCGGKGQAKTNLAKIVAHKLLNLGYVVKVFDISQAWQKSSVPKIVEIGSSVDMNIKLYESVVFDLSRLIPKDVKRFIAHILACEWNAQISVPESERKWIVYVFEESQMLVPQGHLRSVEAQYVLRLMTSGRNFKLGYVAITQRPALTDTSVFELTFQRYFARMDGQNDLKKVASYIGIEKARELQKLKLGEFFYDMANVTKWIVTEEFRSSVRPRKVLVRKIVPSASTKRQAKNEPTTLGQIAMLTQIGSLAVFFIMVLSIALGA